MVINKKSVGKQGEDEAFRFLKKNGFVILNRNYKNKSGRQVGEIDIIAKKDSCIHFIEVKARSGKNIDIFNAEVNITPVKLKKLSKIAEIYIKQKDLWRFEYQFDAFFVIFDETGKIRDFKYLDNIHF